MLSKIPIDFDKIKKEDLEKEGYGDYAQLLEK